MIVDNNSRLGTTMLKSICILPFLLRAVHADEGSLRRQSIALSTNSESMSSNDSKMKMFGFGDCSLDSQCNVCEGSCAHDSDCKGDLVCKEMGLCEKYIACHHEEDHQIVPWCPGDGSAVEGDKKSIFSAFSRGYCVDNDGASTLKNSTMVEGNESSEDDNTGTTQNPDFKLSEEQAASPPTIETETSSDEDGVVKNGEQALDLVEPAEKQASFSPTRQPTTAEPSGNIVSNLLSQLDNGRQQYPVGTITITIGMVATICIIALLVSKYKSKQRGRSKKETLPVSNSNIPIFASTLGVNEDSTSSVDGEVILIVENMEAQEADYDEASIKTEYARSNERSE